MDNAVGRPSTIRLLPFVTSQMVEDQRDGLIIFPGFITSAQTTQTDPGQATNSLTVGRAIRASGRSSPGCLETQET
jgi:hypothetical protein